MKVMMTGFARQQIRKTAKYINKAFGKTSKDNFLQQVQRTKRLLEANPYLGSEEPLLADRSSTYHYVLVNRLNKMVYRVLEEYIEIVDLWDTRREPQQQAEQVKP